MSSRATDYDLLIGELKDTHLTVPEDTSKHEDDFHQIQLSCGTPSSHQANFRTEQIGQGNRISDLSEDFGEICVLPSRPLDLDAQGAL